MTQALSGKVVAVTGGSRGIGLAVCQMLIEAGAKVIVIARTESTLNAACESLGKSTFPVLCDVTDHDQIEAAFNLIKQQFDHIDALINNAGFPYGRKIEKLTPKELMDQTAANYYSAVWCSQQALPLLRKSDNARIINISSASVRNNNEFAHMAAYSSAKAALEQFSKEMRIELKPEGIMVTVLSSGAVGTESTQNFEPEAMGEGFQAWVEKGPMCDGEMEIQTIANSIVHTLNYPRGVGPEFMEVRPNIPTPKMGDTG